MNIQKIIVESDDFQFLISVFIVESDDFQFLISVFTENFCEKNQ